MDRYRGFKAPFSERRLLLTTVDSLLVIISVCGAFVLWQFTAGIYIDVQLIVAYWYMFPVLLGGWWVLAQLHGIYHIPSSIDKISSAVRITSVGFISIIIYQAVFFLIPNNLPRLFFLAYLLSSIPLLILWRWGYATLFKISPLQGTDIKSDQVPTTSFWERLPSFLAALRQPKVATIQQWSASRYARLLSLRPTTKFHITDGDEQLYVFEDDLQDSYDDGGYPRMLWIIMISLLTLTVEIIDTRRKKFLNETIKRRIGD